jgi:hypothetical protein
MDYPALSLPLLTKISHHGFAALYQNERSGEKSLHAAINIRAGNIFATFEVGEIRTAPDKYTLQVNDSTHILLCPEALQYMNHSCNPNVFFNTTSFELSAIRDISKGNELTFFYPSTEWLMESPFNCYCGAEDCLHQIQGASFLSAELINRFKFTDFILKKFQNRTLQMIK